MINSCAFTGHRNLYSDFSIERLRAAIEGVLKKGCRTFYCGMAYGFDLYCCRELLTFKDRYDIKIVACIPYKGQSDGFTKENKKFYNQMLEQCDEEVILHDEFIKGCMFERDRYMVDRSDVVIAYLVEKESGTGYTVKYAESKGIDVVYI